MQCHHNGDGVQVESQDPMVMVGAAQVMVLAVVVLLCLGQNLYHRNDTTDYPDHNLNLFLNDVHVYNQYVKYFSRAYLYHRIFLPLFQLLIFLKTFVKLHLCWFEHL